ncbi:hypothetical protein GYMLUDRAFT_59690 [Collybiopsis luxurians FD-317 M1]|uniref:Uncharacterized protein n=1 Tax=Collybiopsis luxurians FD-317 M1 TaxID=944289 RepID=A0A0D0BX24_9AGAR|nr:hypothetical protein GYMLUDRAFT_59690 [Collybiopsis luxurians FD-317 M1]
MTTLSLHSKKVQWTVETVYILPATWDLYTRVCSVPVLPFFPLPPFSIFSQEQYHFVCTLSWMRSIAPSLTTIPEVEVVETQYSFHEPWANTLLFGHTDIGNGDFHEQSAFPAIQSPPKVFGWCEEEEEPIPFQLPRPYAEPVYSRGSIQQIERVMQTKSLVFTYAVSSQRIYSEDLFDYPASDSDSPEASGQIRSFVTDPFLDVPTEVVEVLLFIPAMTELHPFGPLYSYNEDMFVFRGAFLLVLDETYRGTREQWDVMPLEAKQWIWQSHDRLLSEEHYLTRYQLVRLPLSSDQISSVDGWDHSDREVCFNSKAGTGAPSEDTTVMQE